MLDLSRNAYVFAQALDNSGESEYWIVSIDGGRYDKLAPTDERLQLIRNKIDETMQSGRHLPLETSTLECRATLAGTGVITLRPSTLDIDARISPVLMLINIYGGMRGQFEAALRAIPRVTGRKFNATAFDEIEKFQRLLNWPRPLLFFVLLVATIRNKNQ